MPSDIEQQEEDWVVNQADPNASFMQKFKLYETRSNFYMVGRDKNRTFCRVLKIDRLEPTELSILEDPMAYSELECSDLLKRINEGNRPTGGLKFVITCYGIVGFIRFLGPYYMLLITKRRKIGVICGQAIYAITKSKMIPIPNSTVRSQMAYSKNENRYKRLLCTMDLTKDFFFSYSYHVMCSLQKNLSNSKTGQFVYETMFVWNEFLTRGIRSHLNNTLWTVALVYGFFKQVQLSISGRDFRLTLISRRSRHFAGTRYLKRGVNEKGRVANDVETEQIVFEDVPDRRLLQISSVVQIRGSIPLFWSQETSRLNIKPDIILSRKDHNYDATRLHFQNLVKRYGNPIIILNLIKSREKRPRESILRAEFAHAIDVINTDLSEKGRLKFLHWDLHKQTRNKGANVLSLLGKVAAYALKLTGVFYFQVPATLRPDGLLSQPYFRHKNDGGESDQQTLDENNEHSSKFEREVGSGVNDMVNFSVKPSYQNGVLRTNCIDCLDRTNVAQYAYGLAALGHQLYSLGFIDVPIVDQDGPLADDLMEIYEIMGDTLALQYGGSAAHNKIFSERRGQWKAATQSQEFFRTLQRYYSNAYMDAEKQDAINLFLGYFQPQQDQPALWELDSDRHYNVGSCVPSFDDESARLLFKRSLSDGNILSENNSTIALANVVKESNCDQPFSGNSKGVNMVLSESSPEMSTCESDLSFSRFTPSMPQRQLFQDAQLNQCLESDRLCSGEHSDDCSCSNFVDVDCLSSSVNSFEDETYERSLSTFINSPIVCLSSEDVINESSSESGTSVKGREQIGTSPSYDTAHHYSDSFADWVTCGELLFH